MGKGPEAILNNNKKTHIDGQKIHGMMFSITNHQRNANQNHNEILPHTCQNGYHQKDNKSDKDSTESVDCFG